MSITAKPIVKDKFWVLQNNGERVGLVSKEEDGVHISVSGGNVIVDSVSQAAKKYNITFEKASSGKAEKPSNEIYGFATTTKPHNAMYDVQRKVPLFTKNAKSKSWFAAGFYAIELPNGTTVSLCPKLITLQRYPYSGPFKTKEAALGRNAGKWFEELE